MENPQVGDYVWSPSYKKPSPIWEIVELIPSNLGYGPGCALELRFNRGVDHAPSRVLYAQFVELVPAMLVAALAAE